ncbi:hypothetical protein B0H14DRAFT_2696051 [Mycena olivaceomarginata]|nr:hypothetical protein B0H14DRAFT_2696051 [Mycena olivaceomarginata]
MSPSAKLRETRAPNQRMLRGPTHDPSVITASDNVSCGSSNSDPDDPSCPKGDGAQGRRDSPRRTDSPRLMEMEEGQAEGNEPHQMRNLSWMALHLRIAALEQSQAALIQRIAALEPVPPTLDSESLGQKVKVTFSPWRVLNSVLVLGAGAYKAVATLQGNTAGPTAVDWTVGVLWSLIVYWVSFLDDSTCGQSNWFFSYDLSPVLFIVLEDLVAMGLFAGIMVIALTTILRYEPAGVIPFVVVWCAATSGVGFLVLFPLARRWLLSTLRNLVSNRQLPHFPCGFKFVTSDWSVRNPPGLCIIGLLLMVLTKPVCPGRIVFSLNEGRFHFPIVTILAFFASGLIRMSYRMLTGCPLFSTYIISVF